LPLQRDCDGIFQHTLDAARASNFYCGKFESCGAIVIAFASIGADQGRPSYRAERPLSRDHD
jgi:hypothetical protein